MCRKHHGAAFATFVSVPLTGFHWVAGENEISTYQSSNYGKRTFCGKCGSVTPVVEPETGVVFCPAGNLDGDFGIRAQSHRFVGSKTPWHTITDQLPHHEEV
jgi:hypothetical protein